MTCQELVELVTDYFDGALDAATRAEFDAHLAVCPGCVTYLEQMRTTIRLTHDGARGGPPRPEPGRRRASSPSRSCRSPSGARTWWTASRWSTCCAPSGRRG
jgi:anti-sigma factor RsiW